MTSVTTLLLQAALSLLLLVQNNPNVDNALREQAITIANQAIATATQQISTTPRRLPPQPSNQILTLLSPNGGEVWPGVSQVTDTLSGFSAYSRSITWSGSSSQDPYDGGVEAYLERSVNGRYETIGRIPPFAHGSIQWVVGVVSSENCVLANGAGTNSTHCFWRPNLKVVPPGQYHIRIVDRNTGLSDRSDAPFTIISPLLPPQTGTPTGANTASPTLSFSASPTTIAPGESSVLSWSASNADLCVSTGSTISSAPILATAGDAKVSPLKSARYTLVCYGTRGSTVEKNLTVTVNQPPSTSVQPVPSTPVASVWAWPPSVTVGQKISAAWAVSGGTAGSRDWIGFYRTSDTNQSFQSFKYTNGVTTGIYEVTAPVAGTYEFRYLLNDGYTDVGRSSTVTVTSASVSPVPPPSPTTAITSTGSISANPNPCTIPSGSSSCTVTISWQSNAANAAIDRVDNDGSSNPVVFATGSSGSQAVQVAATPGYYFRLFSDNAKTQRIATTPLVRGQQAQAPQTSTQGTCPSGSTWFSGNYNTACSASLGTCWTQQCRADFENAARYNWGGWWVQCTNQDSMRLSGGSCTAP